MEGSDVQPTLLIDSFDFVTDVTPFSSLETPVYTCIIYLTLLLLCKLLVRFRGKSFNAALQPIVIGHNIFLSLGSALLLAALLYELFENAQAVGGTPGHKLWTIWCDEPPRRFTKGRLYFYYYVNYLFKFYEMADTLILALRDRPTPFLHVYHHAATMVLCWSQLREHSTTQWVPIVINLAIHVAMYYYYAMASLGINVWWKRHLTTAQIVQFVIDVWVCAYATYLKYIFHLGSDDGADCGGTMLAGYFGTGLLFSYLVLFINFYLANYIYKKVQKKQKAL